MSTPTSRRAAKSTASTAPTPDLLAAQRIELTALRARTGALAADDRAVFLARHDNAACEKLAKNTKAAGTLKDAVSVLRQLYPVKRSAQKEIAFLAQPILANLAHSASALANRLASNTAEGNTESDDLAFARSDADALYRRTRKRVRNALGSNETWQAKYDAQMALTTYDSFDRSAARLLLLADALPALSKLSSALARSLTMEGITDALRTKLLQAGTRLEEARKSATTGLDAGNDPPDVNVLEGRVLYALRMVLNATRQGREDGETTLVLKLSRATLSVLVRRNRSESTEGDPTPEEE